MKAVLFSIICGLLCILEGCGFGEEPTVICFVGDSITYQWDVEFFFPEYNTVKYAENGAPLEKMDDWNLSQCKDNATVVLLGTNNSSSFYTEDDQKEFVQDYVDRVKKIEASPLVVVSILPRNFLGKQDTMVNVVIQEVNGMIRDFLDRENVKYRYVNVYPDFIDDGIKIRNDLFKDGLHPNIHGQEKLAAAVQRAL